MARPQCDTPLIYKFLISPKSRIFFGKKEKEKPLWKKKKKILIFSFSTSKNLPQKNSNYAHNLKALLHQGRIVIHHELYTPYRVG
jgi:hypothetical protein